MVKDVKFVAEDRTEVRIEVRTEAHSAAVDVDVDVVVISEEKEIAKSVTLLAPKSVLTKRWRLTG